MTRAMESPPVTMDQPSESEPRKRVPHVAVVIPMYRAEDSIARVIAGMPAYVRTIVVVDDASPDASAARCLEVGDPRVDLVHHAHNQGVGGAMRTGYRRALELGADVMVKMDSDGQMDPHHMPQLLAPVLTGEADYAKGNRFVHAVELADMPLLRRIGNVGLSFLTKLASGYWNVFDPTNGYTAIHRAALRHLDQEALSRGYYFESSMLVELALAGAVVRDVDIPARYRSEKSSLSEGKLLLAFPPRLLRSFLRRVWIVHFVRDFGLFSLFAVSGFLLLVFGLCFGLYHWIWYAEQGTGAPVGTVMLSVLPIILGVQLLLQAVVLDVQSTPTVPLQQRERSRARALLRNAIEKAVPIPRPGAQRAPSEPTREPTREPSRAPAERDPVEKP
jgi:glycosyltransferase involved in cell wall biosynthesis